SNRRPAGFIPQASWRWNPSIRDDWVSARVLIRFAFFPCPIGPQLGTQFRSDGRALDLARRSFAHLAFWLAAIFLFTALLTTRFFFAGGPRRLLNSLLSISMWSLIAAARLSCFTVRSSGFMGSAITTQTRSKSSSFSRCLAGAGNIGVERNRPRLRIEVVRCR